MAKPIKTALPQKPKRTKPSWASLSFGEGAPVIEEAEKAAIRAVYQGEATPHQMRLAMDWIIDEACGFGLMSHRPDNQHETAFNEGRRCVGIILNDLTRRNDVRRSDEQR